MKMRPLSRRRVVNLEDEQKENSVNVWIISKFSFNCHLLLLDVAITNDWWRQATYAREREKGKYAHKLICRTRHSPFDSNVLDYILEKHCNRKSSSRAKHLLQYFTLTFQTRLLEREREREEKQRLEKHFSHGGEEQEKKRRSDHEGVTAIRILSFFQWLDDAFMASSLNQLEINWSEAVTCTQVANSVKQSISPTDRVLDGKLPVISDGNAPFSFSSCSRLNMTKKER